MDLFTDKPLKGINLFIYRFLICFFSVFVLGVTVIGIAGGQTSEYRAAVLDARQPSQDDVRNDLTPIRADVPGLIWRNGPGSEVLVVHVSAHFLAQGIKNAQQRARRLWVTVGRELQEECQERDIDTVSRLRQLLGFPPDHPIEYAVEIFVDESFLRRPARDPEITDSRAEPTGAPTWRPP